MTAYRRSLTGTDLGISVVILYVKKLEYAEKTVRSGWPQMISHANARDQTPGHSDVRLGMIVHP